MISMRAHQKKIFAQQQKRKTAAAHSQAAKSQYKKWLGKLKADQREIKSLTDHADRNKMAAVKIDSYLGYLNGWLESGAAHQNDVLTQCVVWATDGKRWDVLFKLADPAIKNPKIGNLHWMKRSLAEFVASGVISAADIEKKANTEIQAPVQDILERIQQEKWEVNNVISARYHKFCGILAEEKEDWQKAFSLFKTADELYPNIAVKGRLKNAEKQLKTKPTQPRA